MAGVSLPSPRMIFEDALELVGKIIEHDTSLMFGSGLRPRLEEQAEGELYKS